MDDPFGALCRHDQVRREPRGRGRLNGATFAAKDLFSVAGHRNCAGNPDWLRNHEPAPEDAPVIDALLRAGATLTAMAVMDELAYSIAGRNSHYGTPINPAFPEGIPGGSSSGSAVAVAGGLADFAIGTDTTGSIRTPAALCGIIGLRPTYGTVNVEGVVPLAPAFDTVGFLARSLDLLDRVVESVGVPAGGVRPSRALLATDAMALADDGVQRALQPAIDALAGHVPLSRIVASAEGLPVWADWVRTVQANDIWRVHGPWIERVHPAFGPGVAERFAAAATVTDAARDAAEAKRQGAARRVRDLLGADAILVFPTSPSPAPSRQAPEAGLGEWRTRAMALTSIANVSGCPQITLPMARVGGAPVGLSLLGPPGSERALVALATRAVGEVLAAPP